MSNVFKRATKIAENVCAAKKSCGKMFNESSKPPTYLNHKLPTRKSPMPTVDLLGLQNPDRQELKRVHQIQVAASGWGIQYLEGLKNY